MLWALFVMLEQDLVHVSIQVGHEIYCHEDLEWGFAPFVLHPYKDCMTRSVVTVCAITFLSSTIIAGRRLLFNDFLDFEVDSHQGNCQDRGDDPNVTLAAAGEHTNIATQRVSEATVPFDFDDELVVATVELVMASRLSGSFLKENLSFCFKEFDMLKLRYMCQIPASVEIRAPLPLKCID